MSRRNKEKHHRPEPKPDPVPLGSTPDPPPPNRPLLIFAVVLTVVWVGILAVLAVFT